MIPPFAEVEGAVEVVAMVDKVLGEEMLKGKSKGRDETGIGNILI